VSRDAAEQRDARPAFFETSICSVRTASQRHLSHAAAARLRPATRCPFTTRYVIVQRSLSIRSASLATRLHQLSTRTAARSCCFCIDVTNV